jgi:hypothetical protein
LDPCRQASYGKKRGLWSGLKQIFHSGRPGSLARPNSRQRSATAAATTLTTTHTSSNRLRPLSRGDLQSLSYSCLGQARRREGAEEEDEDYEEEEEYMREQARRLSRNLSLSHESVFHIDSHNAQVSCREKGPR